MRLLTRSTLGTSVLLLAALGTAVGSMRPEREDTFRQLDELLPTPTTTRTASGAPGHDYWQQRADYVIDVEIDDVHQHLTGSETITYHNNSPDQLAYLWVSLDPNIYAPDSHSVLSRLAPSMDSASFRSIRSLLERPEFDGGCKITSVRTPAGDSLPHTINGTMMRIDLPHLLASGQSTSFKIDWNYAINNSKKVRGRTGAEFFEEDGNWLYEMAQWFPRMAAYTDYGGWCNDQFLGSGEFTLEFGDYLVNITVPDDHVVASTGTLQNPDEVLTDEQQRRLEESRTSSTPMFIVTPDEAKENQAEGSTGTRTWTYQAQNVRDFAFASSRKFLWDAMGVEVGGNTVMAMSYWPIEGEPLWSRYSTHSIAHTLEVYSKFTFDYPYPVAISVNGPVGGMEYPMICFNGPRPEEDGTYSPRTKYGLISVIIHEVGHNWFPMIVNSDERQWTWMDEGLNTFCQFLAEEEWEHEYPARRGEPRDITSYMSSSEQVPIMTNSESLLQFGANAYAKPATALNVLRESVMGRELFDFAFKSYAQRWMFKRPEPADLFRTLEDASAVDLDWFWHAWFYTTDHVDLNLAGLHLYTIDTRDPDIEKPRRRELREAEPTTLTEARNLELPKYLDRYPELADFYNSFDELDVTDADRREFRKYMDGLEEDQRGLLELDRHFYVLDIVNDGGIVAPVPVRLTYADGSSEELTIPVDAWRRDSSRITKLVIARQKIETALLDPRQETADTDTSNNVLPREVPETRIRLSDRPAWGRGGGKNPMQRARAEAEREDEAAGDEKADEGAPPSPSGSQGD